MELIVISAVWCPSCLVMKKIIKDIETNYTDLKIIKYDYDLNEDDIKDYNVGDNLPLFILLKDGKEISRMSGEHSYEEMVNFINC